MKRRTAGWRVMGMAIVAAYANVSNAGINPSTPMDLAASPPEPGGVARPVYVINHVNVIPLTAPGEVLLDASVVIEGEKISALKGQPPQGAIAIEGKGKWLIPGFSSPSQDTSVSATKSCEAT